MVRRGQNGSQLARSVEVTGLHGLVHICWSSNLNQRVSRSTVQLYVSSALLAADASPYSGRIDFLPQRWLRVVSLSARGRIYQCSLGCRLDVFVNQNFVQMVKVSYVSFNIRNVNVLIGSEGP